MPLPITETIACEESIARVLLMDVAPYRIFLVLTRSGPHKHAYTRTRIRTRAIGHGQELEALPDASAFFDRPHWFSQRTIETHRACFRRLLEKLQSEQAMGNSIISANEPTNVHKQQDSEFQSEPTEIRYLQNASDGSAPHEARWKRKRAAEKNCGEIIGESDSVGAGGKRDGQTAQTDQLSTHRRAVNGDDDPEGSRSCKVQGQGRRATLSHQSSANGMDQHIIVDEDEDDGGEDDKKSLGQRLLDPVRSFGGKVAGKSLFFGARPSALL